MKLKINKACDLSSISVLPPQSRRLSGVPSAPQASSQLRSQMSQQSVSQGLSSQHGMFSQFSQTSVDDVFNSDQRVNSQERENSVKKTSCLPAITYPREDSQMQLSRPSNLMRKWNSASTPDNRCQVSEELERRIGMMENSLSRIAILLESVQSDVMQVNRGTKEVLLEAEGIRQKLNALDNSSLLMNKEQEDFKSSIDEGFTSLSAQLGKDTKTQEKIQEIFLTLSDLPQKMETFTVKLQNELCSNLMKEIQACKQRSQNQACLVPTVLSPEKSEGHSSPREKLMPLRNQNVPTRVYKRRQHCSDELPRVFKRVQHHDLSPIQPTRINMQVSNVSKKFEGGSLPKVKEVTFYREQEKQNKNRANLLIEQGRACEIIIDSDEEIDKGFCCLFEEDKGNILCEKRFGNYSMEDAKEETKQILKKARRQKRKSYNPIIIS